LDAVGGSGKDRGLFDGVDEVPSPGCDSGVDDEIVLLFELGAVDVDADIDDEV
jgi:hypothetical protein